MARLFHEGNFPVGPFWSSAWLDRWPWIGGYISNGIARMPLKIPKSSLSVLDYGTLADALVVSTNDPSAQDVFDTIQSEKNLRIGGICMRLVLITLDKERI